MIEINSGSVTSIGIVFDIIGAFFLAQSFLFKKIDRIIKETSSYYNGNPFLLPSCIAQRLEAKTGFVFLFIGFLTQMIANTDIINQGKDKIFWLIIILGVLLWLITLLIVKCWAKKICLSIQIERNGDSFLKSLNETKEKNPEKLTNLALFFGDALDFFKGKNENNISYNERLISFIERKMKKKEIKKTKKLGSKNQKSWFMTYFANHFDIASDWLKTKTTLNLQDWIIGILFVPVFLIVPYYDKFELKDITQIVVLWLTFLAILWYSKETYWLKDVTQKQLKHERALGDFEVMPFLRLQFVSWEQDRFMQLVNDGRGLAKNIKLRANHADKYYTLKVLPVIANGPSTPSGIDLCHIIGANSQLFERWKKEGSLSTLDLEFTGEYEDFCSRIYSVKFKYNNEHIKDRFEIIEQKPKDWNFGDGITDK